MQVGGSNAYVVQGGWATVTHVGVNQMMGITLFHLIDVTLC